MDVPVISTPLLKIFRHIVRGYFRRHFHAVRVSGIENLQPNAQPLIVYANHCSWWDPMVAILLADRLMRQRRHYAPMDAEALARYGILKRLGIFAVEMNSPRGGVAFLRTGEAILEAGGVMWVTPQGKFADVREGSLEFKPGLAALAVRAASETQDCAVIPLAIEYTFWDERLPECLLRFGEPVMVSAKDTASMVGARLREALQSEMDALRELAMRRSGAGFETLVEGSSGTGGFYALGQRFKAWMLRRKYHPNHTETKQGGSDR